MSTDKKRSQSETQWVPNIMQFFGLPASIGTERLTAGFVNDNIVVDTSKGTFVVKFLKRLRIASIENDIAIQEQLLANHIGSIQYLHNNNGDFLYRDNEIAAVVSPMIEGVNPQPYKTETAIALATALGQFHNTVKKLPHNYKAWLNPQIAHRPIQKEKNPLTGQARELIAEGIELFDSNLPYGIIHSDLHEDNALILATEPSRVIAIMDFEEAEQNVFLVDIARAILSTCRDKTNNALDHLLIDTYISAYNKQRELTNKEIDSLSNAIYYAGGVAMLWFIENDYPQYALQYAHRARSSTSVNDI